MTYTRIQQEGFLASISQAFDVGDFEYLAPQDLNALNILIANVWQAFTQSEDIGDRMDEIGLTLGRKQVNN
jgi:hypothetical protein